LQKKLIVVFVFMLCLSASVLSGTENIKSGYISHNITTLHGPYEIGLDFNLEVACTTETNTKYFSHILIGFYQPLSLFVQSGYSIKMGKINLDSIKTAPSDSVFYKNSRDIIDRIPYDSLSSCIGNAYILKTGNDPRPAFSGVYYAKIKIVGLNIIDSAKGKYDLTILWACQLSLGRDLTTSGLDTFKFSTAIQHNNIIKPIKNSSYSIQNTFKAIGNRFVIPNELYGTVTMLSVYDLAGKKVSDIHFSKETRAVDLEKLQEKAKGIFLVKLQ
jgi:hypothetical protein